MSRRAAAIRRDAATEILDRFSQRSRLRPAVSTFARHTARRWPHSPSIGCRAVARPGWRLQSLRRPSPTWRQSPWLRAHRAALPENRPAFGDGDGFEQSIPDRHLWILIFGQEEFLWVVVVVNASLAGV